MINSPSKRKLRARFASSRRHRWLSRATGRVKTMLEKKLRKSVKEVLKSPVVA